MYINYEVLQSRINDLCAEHGLSINGMLKQAGLNKSVMDNIKRKREPSADKLFAIANFFNVSIDYLLGRVNAPNVKLIPADPEKAIEYEEWLNKQREDSFMQLAEAIKKATPEREQPVDPNTEALLKEIQDLNEDEAAKAQEYVRFLKQQRNQQP